MTFAQLAAPALLASATLLTACSTAKPEAASLVASVDRFHRASNDERPSRAEAVLAVACQSPDVCEAKAACVAPTTKTAEALRLKHDAERVLAELDSGKRTREDPEVVGLPDKLDRAARLLTEGHDTMPACDQKILVLRERYGL